MKSGNYLKILLLTYVISTGFTEVLHLPWSKVQLPELVFIPLFITWFVFIGWNGFRSKFSFTGFDMSLLLLLIVYVLSSSLAGSTRSWLETLGLGYLLLVYFIFRTSLVRIPDSNSFIKNAFVACGIIAASAGVIGWTLVQFGIDNPMAWSSDRVYPYLGNIGRAEGFTDTPNMLLNLLAVCFLFFLPGYIKQTGKKFIDHLIIAVLILGILLTFSKSILVLIIAVFYILHAIGFLQSTNRKTFSVVTCMILFFVFVIGSHMLVINKSNVDWEMLKENAYTLDHPLMQTVNYYLVQTNYSVNKITSLRAGFENIFFGVGPGGFNQYVKEAKLKGEYPTYFPDYDPHSIYAGTFAELGIAGFLALLLIFYMIIKKLKRSSENETSTKSTLIIGITACLIFLAVDGIVLDMLNFRHLWVLKAILSLPKHAHDIKPICKD